MRPIAFAVFRLMTSSNLPLKVPQVAYADRKFDSPSGKIEFYSDKLALPPLPVHKVDKDSHYPLALKLRANADANSYVTFGSRRLLGIRPSIRWLLTLKLCLPV